MKSKAMFGRAAGGRRDQSPPRFRTGGSCGSETEDFRGRRREQTTYARAFGFPPCARRLLRVGLVPPYQTGPRCRLGPQWGADRVANQGGVATAGCRQRAVTSAGSSELIAVSSLCTYDIYRTYINPEATGKQILKVSRGAILIFGCFMGSLAVILNKAGVSLSWMYLAMGILIGSAVFPISLMLLWRKANAFGAILGTTSGCILGIVTWLAVTKIEYGRVDLDTTGRNGPMLAGNLVSVLTGGVVHAVSSLLWPQEYDWETTKQITTVEKVTGDLTVDEFREEKLMRAKSWIIKRGLAFTIIMVIVWPLLTLPAGQFSLGYFTFWAVISIAWGTIGSIVIIVLPLIESWQTISSVCGGIFTNDRLTEKIDELNLSLRAIMSVMPEAQQNYLLEKEKAKKLEGLEGKKIKLQY